MAVDRETFKAIFSRFPDPVFLRLPDQWCENAAAKTLRFSASDRDILAHLKAGEASRWIRGVFYHVTTCTVHDGAYYILRKDSFLDDGGTNIAIQLREKLSSAFLSLHRLSRDPSTDSGKRTEELAAVNRSLHQILRMVEQLEMFSAPQELFYRPASMDLADLLRSFYHTLKTLFEGSSVTIKLELLTPTLVLEGDENKLRYLVSNMISNAVKALPHNDGTVTISLRRVKNQAVITVTGTGEPIPIEVMSAPLWTQPDRLVAGRGLGLGLPLMERIVQAHGGTLVVNSGEGMTQMIVSIPAGPPRLMFASPEFPYEASPGFTQDMITLSDVLPKSLYKVDL